MWGQQIGLGTDANPRSTVIDAALGQEHIQTAVAALLACFVKIWEDAEGSQSRYGLAPQSDRTSKSTDDSQYSEDFSPLDFVFRRTYNKFRGDSSQRQKGTTLLKKARWAVADETRFRRLIADLKAINDSLHSLLPTIRDRARVQMRREIMQSTDKQQLQQLQQSSDEPFDPITDTVSLRLEMLSTRGGILANVPALSDNEGVLHGVRPSVAAEKISSQSGSDLSSPAASTTTDGVAHITLDLPSATQRDASQSISASLRPTPSKDSSTATHEPYDPTGALVIHKVYAQDEIPSFFFWHVGDDNVSQPKHELHSSLNNELLCPSELLHCCEQLLECAVESDPRYSGWAAASVSLKGFSRERYASISPNKRPEPKLLVRIAGTPGQGVQIIDRWNEIRRDGGLGSNWTTELGRVQVNKLVGYSENVWLDPDEDKKLRHQISDLIASLNRTDLFPSFVGSGSIGGLALAKELALRLDRDRDQWHGGLSIKVVYDMLAANAWMKNMDISSTSEGTFDYEIVPETLRKRIASMLSFAEIMRWPFLIEVRQILGKYTGKNDPINVRTFDWLSGLTLPRSLCALTLMLGLCRISPSLQNTLLEGKVRIHEGEFGLVLPQVSYWRSLSIVGRVLAAYPGVHDVCGWVGPCMSPSGLEQHEQSGKLLQIQARTPTFKRRDTSLTSEHQPAILSSKDSRFVTSVLPAQYVEDCVLRRLHLAPLFPEEKFVVGPAEAPFYRAKVEFYLTKASKLVTFNLYSNSIFIAAPACAGIHKIDRESSSAYKGVVYDVSELDRAELVMDGMTVINAMARGAEAAARAWCAEKATKAVIWKRGMGCCYKCGLMTARIEGVDVGVLILCC